MAITQTIDLEFRMCLEGTAFPLADANGNAVTYIDEAGNVQAHYVYDAFGGTVSQSGEMADDFRFRFSSKYLDDETELYYYGYRYYNPATGRWLSRDPIGDHAFMRQRHSRLSNQEWTLITQIASFDRHVDEEQRNTIYGRAIIESREILGDGLMAFIGNSVPNRVGLCWVGRKRFWPSCVKTCFGMKCWWDPRSIFLGLKDCVDCVEQCWLVVPVGAGGKWTEWVTVNTRKCTACK